MPKRLNLTVPLGAVPLDPALSRAANTGRPVLLDTPDGPQARAFLAIADELLDRLAACD